MAVQGVTGDMPDSILSADPAALNRSAIRRRLRAIADHERATRRARDIAAA